MAAGWTRDGAVQDQVDDPVADAVLAARQAYQAERVNRSVQSAATTSPKDGAVRCLECVPA